MSENNKSLKIHPKARAKEDEYTNVSVSESPIRGKRDNFSKGGIVQSVCGVCGNTNTKNIYHTSGATSDGTVDVQEIQCLDCGCFTEYYFSDRM